jgi:LPS sulfotransferase NodH
MPDSYIICSTPRSGSTLLCGLLAATGAAGEPDSYFMGELDPVWIKEWGLPPREAREEEGYATAYLQAAIKAGRGKTSLFGLRLMKRDLTGLLDLIGASHPDMPSDRARLEAAFGETRFLHLSREDKLAQAVSLVRAEQSGLWHVAPDGREVERLAPPRPPQYDFARLLETLTRLEEQDAAWLEWFAQEEIEPLPLRYESLAADPAKTLRQICCFLEIPAPAADGPEPVVAKLADELSAEWMRRFLSDREDASRSA